MKNKTVAGVLALVMGYLGLHRFYLGQIGLGIAYLILVPSLMASSSLWWIGLIGVIDAVVFFSMDRDDFDEKYNRKAKLKQEREQFRKQDRRRNRDYDRNRRYEAEPQRKTPPKRKAKRARPDAHMKAGKEMFADYDFEGAIAEYEKALKAEPQNVAAHFNLACAHSLMEHKDKSFYHLDRAVALGFNDFELIKTRDHLAYLRVQPEFESFAENGFRLSKQGGESKATAEPTATAPTQPQPGDLLAQLEKLARLKEKGLLTEREFQVQKEKLMR